MKYRKDYVTNSSSSSFICDVCGDEASGYDISLSDAEMAKCVNHHTVCTCHLLPRPNKKEMIEAILKKEWNTYTEEELQEMNEDELFKDELTDCGNYGIPETMCPICQFKEYTYEDMFNYLLKKFNLSAKTVLEEVKDKFRTYENFLKFIKK